MDGAEHGMSRHLCPGHLVGACSFLSPVGSVTAVWEGGAWRSVRVLLCLCGGEGACAVPAAATECLDACGCVCGKGR